ncbi:hypothetical protein [Bacillus sp. AFS040349]|uniref:hypothetical protein n=1 Tax=Bacillus sp. AFS040349 TaxID=2033502 RepID=UPI000BFBD303|nr:hypothetical protein [Bacillus sp. AFS040349]PGT83284.1 hypothetical protein COD11_13190 [Bacillus sp. AFS040349]
MKKVLSLSLAGLIAGSSLFATGAAAATPKQNAINLGEQLQPQLRMFNGAIDSGYIKNIDDKYDALSQQIKNVEKAIGKVSGSSNRKQLNEKYVTPAKIARERVIYEVSQYRLLNAIDTKLFTNASVNISGDLAKLDRLQKRAVQIKEAGGYKSLPNSIDASLASQEKDIREHKNPAKENTVVLDEVEPNDDFSTATTLGSGVVYKGSLNYSSDREDLYEINVETPGKSKVVRNGGSYLYVYVYDEDNNSVPLDYDGYFEANTAGKYYVKVVHGGISNGTESYTLKVTYPTKNNNQSNDTLLTAHPIKTGRTYFSTMDTNNDVDFYILNVSTLGQLTVSLGFNAEDKYVSVYDKYGNVIRDSITDYYSPIRVNTEYVGQYYVSIKEYGSWSTTNPYSLTVDFQ